MTLHPGLLFRTRNFIEKAKRYTAINELTPELLRLFIQRIEVGERGQKYSRSASQSVRIIYRDIGVMDGRWSRRWCNRRQKTTSFRFQHSRSEVEMQ